VTVPLWLTHFKGQDPIVLAGQASLSRQAQHTLLSTSPARNPYDISLYKEINMRYSLILGSVASFLASVSAHSWVEQVVNVNDNGSYYGPAGYIRGYVPRDNPSFSDTKLSWLSPQNSQGGSRTRIDNTDILCHPNQQQAVNNKDFPNLKTAPGNTVALRYLENGHVSLPNNQLGKPASAGLVYIYATTNPKPDEKLTNVLNWTMDGNLDEGRLLNINPYDDGRCYQINDSGNSPISTQRQAEFPNPIAGQPGTNHELWCQNNIKVPDDAADNTLTVYWIWQWPTQPNVDPNLPEGKDEIYTSCMDFDLVSNQGVVKSAAGGVSLGGFQDSAPALKDFMQRLDNTTLPNNPVYYNPGTPFGSAKPSQTNAASASTQVPGPGQFAPQDPSTMQTSTSPSAQTTAFVSQPGVVYVTTTTTELATVTVYDNAPTGAKYKRSAKFRW
jgi:hypothetical protein